jgi:hypothetical protein
MRAHTHTHTHTRDLRNVMCGVAIIFTRYSTASFTRHLLLDQFKRLIPASGLCCLIVLSCILWSLLNMSSASARTSQRTWQPGLTQQRLCVCVCVCMCSSEAAACTDLYEHVTLCLVLRASRVQISTRRLMCGATF